MSEELSLREVVSAKEFEACYDLQRATWGDGFAELVPVTVMRIAQRMGGVVAGAFDAQDQLVGFVFGITGVEPSSPDRPSIPLSPAHWSDMLAVRPELRNQGVGEALKRFQRTLLLDRGVSVAYWTFDPLESKNAYINFARLGIIAREYRRDLYGDSRSPLHSGIGTDRLIAIWELDSDRVRAALSGQRRDNAGADHAPWAVESIEKNGLPMSIAPRLDQDADVLRIAIPADLQLLKSRQLELALTWRAHTRAAFEHYLERGYVVAGFRRAGATSAYTLVRAALLS